MKKIVFLLIFFSFVFPPTAIAESNISFAKKLSGKVLLQVEDEGQAWYVNPNDLYRYYLKDGASAYQLLIEKGLGISNENISKIPVGIEQRLEEKDSDNDGLPDKLEEALGTDPYNPDTDGDGYSDGVEVKYGYNPLGPGKLQFDNALVNKLKGRILLQVESSGEAWYVNPDDGKRYYMQNGEAAYNIMKYFGLGIKTDNLNFIYIEPVRWEMFQILKKELGNIFENENKNFADISTNINKADYYEEINNEICKLLLEGNNFEDVTFFVYCLDLSELKTKWRINDLGFNIGNIFESQDKETVIQVSMIKTKELFGKTFFEYYNSKITDDYKLNLIWNKYNERMLKEDFFVEMIEGESSIYLRIMTYITKPEYAIGLMSTKGEGFDEKRLDVLKKVRLENFDLQDILAYDRDFYNFIISAVDKASTISRDTKRIIDIKQIQTALELYYNDEWQYPDGNNLILGIGDGVCLSSEGFGASDCGVSRYMSQIPINPTPGGMDYVYTRISDNEYDLSFYLENDAGNLRAGNNCATENGIESVACSRVSVSVSLELQIGSVDHAKGNELASITIIEYSDFQCPYCQRFHGTLSRLLEEYPDDIRWVYRHFPLTSIHPQAQKAAAAAECAGDQGKFWEYSDILFERQIEIDEQAFEVFANELNLMLPEFNNCLDLGKYYDKVDDDLQSGLSLGVQGTPASFVNGDLVVGNVPYNTLKLKIDNLLE